ncbi:Sec34-like family-domain-containing protein [Dioszegia hungarica]|uniref:Conserved oligomeric Golgi complex subunit 3 n=1 Tax=Dioszegia hungarica TaxID=4972 RepID=A0AA38HBY3_9TREE|nr:Sec34-like family-domain-containing protein [Dioszegia hungarica]KAI9637525.1 Sec34-like family-domain-containing protein [Dioszegia hungarica]
MSRSSTPSSGFQFRRPNLAAISTAAGGSTSSTSAQAQAQAQAGQGRSNTTQGLGQGRTTISLEEWEARAPLNDEEVKMVREVGEKLKERPMPEKQFRAQAEAGPSRPSTPLPLRRLAHPPRASTPLSTPLHTSTTQITDPLRPEIITTAQEFQDHFHALTLSTEHEQDSLYRDQLGEISGLREKCEELLGILEGAGEGVGEMMRALEYVEERSESLRGACEDLLEEQTHLLTHTSQLSHRLTFFTFLETAQRILNNPSPTLVLSEDFLPMLKRLDECIGYLSEHRDFKDAELYLIRYQQCMTRSMTLIKIYFVSSVRSTGQEVGKKLYDKSLSETATQALLFPKFSSLASSLRPLIHELETRASRSNDELAPLLAECHSAWIGTRQGLMGPRVAEEVGRLDPEKGELVDLTRAGCGYLKQMCLEEFNLFKSFFLSGEAQLYSYLESLCDALYDHLRPRILHEPALEILCGVCTVLQALMVADIDPNAEDDDTATATGTAIYTPHSSYSPSPGPNGPGASDDYFSVPPPRRPGPQRREDETDEMEYVDDTPSRSHRTRRHKPLARLHTEVLLRMVLQDAQTRLVFRAQAMLVSEVEYYVVKEGDLDYPEKLGKGEKSLVQRNEDAVSLDDEDEPAFLALPNEEAQEGWYPTLRVTLWVLSCLWRYVDQAVFEDLAQEAILTCRRSLSAASDVLGNKKDKSVDGRLFLVRHLLILKEMTAGLDLGRRVGRKEWGGITDFLRSLLEGAGVMLGYGKSSGRANEPISDAKSDIDRELKKACEELIAHCARSSTVPLRTFLNQCTTYLHTPPPSSSDLSQQPFATPSKVTEAHDTFKSEVRGKMDEWVGGLRRYLGDEATVAVLVPPAENAIVDVYRQFHDLVRAEYDFSTAAGLMTPSAVSTLLAGAR